MNKTRQTGLNMVFVDCCKNGQIKESLGYLIEHRINVYAEDVQEIARKGVNIFEKNTQEDILNKPIGELKR